MVLEATCCIGTHDQDTKNKTKQNKTKPDRADW